MVRHCVENVRIRSFSVPYFPAFGLNIQFKCGKILTRKTLNTNTFYAMREPPIMIPTGEKVECLSLVNYSAKTNHDNNDNTTHCHREDDST